MSLPAGSGGHTFSTEWRDTERNSRHLLSARKPEPKSRIPPRIARSLRQTLSARNVTRKLSARQTCTTHRQAHTQLVYTYPVTAYSVGMHVQSDLHEAALAPLRHPASSAGSWGNYG